MSSKRYATITDVIDQEVRPPLDKSLVEECFDLEAIASEISEYKTDTRVLPSGETAKDLNTAGFEVTADQDEFWAIVQKHELPYSELGTKIASDYDLQLGSTSDPLNAWRLAAFCFDNIPHMYGLAKEEAPDAVSLFRSDGQQATFRFNRNDDGDIIGWSYSVYADHNATTKISSGENIFTGLRQRHAIMVMLGVIYNWAQGA